MKKTGKARHFFLILQKNEPDRTASGAVSGRVLVPRGSAPPIHFIIPRHSSSPHSDEVFRRGWNKSFCLRHRQGVSSIALLIFAAVFIIASFSFVSLKFSDKNNLSSGENLFSRTSAVILKTLGGAFSSKEKKPVLEIDLGKNSDASESSSEKISVVPASSKKIPNQSPKKSTPVENTKNNIAESFSTLSQQTENNPAATSVTETQVQKKISDCIFSTTGVSNHQIIFSELNWAGDKESANNEWIEIKNNSGRDIALNGWQILSGDGNIKIIFKEGNKISSGELYLLERTDDNSVPNIAADAIYAGALSNNGAYLKIFDADCNLSDEIDASKKWPAGDSAARKTMERSILDFSWHTSNSPGGTPKKENSTAFSKGIDEISQPVDSPANNQPATSTQSNSQTQTQIIAKNLVITEVMAGIDGNSSYEFVELYNPSSDEIDLTGWTIKKRSSTGSESPLVISSRMEGKKITPNKHFLIANEAVSSIISNADVYWPKSYTLAYINNAVVIYDSGNTKIDEVGWTDIPAGSSYERKPISSGQFIIEPNPNPQNSIQ
ncbi:MAG: lamin tail domain-containing protein [Candidatus Liptonbacteria bacterium]|nr:lamin tail domain-containing protein [Candidatus Liptonbacteria bacterium]